MDMEGALRARVVAAAPTVAGRVYWVDRPQTSGLPAVTLQIINDTREQTMDGFQGRQFASVQCDIWAKTYAEGKAIKEAVIASVVPKATVNGVKFGRAEVSSRDLSERTDTQFIHRPSLDFTINYAPE